MSKYIASHADEHIITMTLCVYALLFSLYPSTSFNYLYISSRVCELMYAPK